MHFQTNDLAKNESTPIICLILHSITAASFFSTYLCFPAVYRMIIHGLTVRESFLRLKRHKRQKTQELRHG